MKLQKFVKAADCWYPNYSGDRVQVSLITDVREPVTSFRVCVWGEDDFGMEKSFDNFMAAKKVFKEIPSPVTAAKLKDLGFTRA